MQQGNQLFRICLSVEYQQGSQLCVAVLLHNVNDIVLLDEFPRGLVDWECFDAAIIQIDILLFETIERLSTSRVATANRQNGSLVGLRIFDIGRGKHVSRCFPLDQQAIHNVLIFVRVLGVGAKLRMARSACEIRTLRMRAWQRAIRNAVSVHIEVAIEGLRLLQVFRRQDLAAIRHMVFIPRELGNHPVVHADIEIRQHHNRRLQTFGEIERGDSRAETFIGIGRKQQHMFCIAVRCVSAGQYVCLLRPRRHSRRRTSALHVEDDSRNFCVVGESDELTHERNSRAAG